MGVFSLGTQRVTGSQNMFIITAPFGPWHLLIHVTFCAKVIVLPTANTCTLSSMGLVWGVPLGGTLTGCPYRPILLHNRGMPRHPAGARLLGPNKAKNVMARSYTCADTRNTSNKPACTITRCKRRKEVVGGLKTLFGVAK